MERPAPDRLGRFVVWGAFLFAGVAALVNVATNEDGLALAVSAPAGILLIARGILQLRFPNYREQLIVRRRRSFAKQYPSPTVAGSYMLMAIGGVWVLAAMIGALNR